MPDQLEIPAETRVALAAIFASIAKALDESQAAAKAIAATADANLVQAFRQFSQPDHSQAAVGDSSAS